MYEQAYKNLFLNCELIHRGILIINQTHTEKKTTYYVIAIL